MTTLTRRPSVTIGVVLLALFGLVDLLSPWIFPAPADAPPLADTVTLVAGVIALVVLALWVATSSRAAMWVEVVLRVIGAAFSVLAIADPLSSTGFVVASVVYIALTVVAIVLVAPTLRAGSDRRSDTAMSGSA